MPERSSFLRAICDRPQDDLPRLAYADWLEERGDPRGEFIRVQCELAQINRELDPVYEESGYGSQGYLWARPPLRGRHEDLRQRHRALQERERALLAEHGAAWRPKPLAPDAAFRRGFILEADLTVLQQVRSLEKLLQAEPLPNVIVANNPTQARIGELAELPALSEVRGLQFNVGIRDEHIAILLRSPHLRHLKRLNLAGTRCRQQGLAALERAEFHDLESLDIQSTALQVLPRLERFARLSDLNLRANPRLSNVRILEKAPRLACLNLSSTAVQDLGPLALLGALQKLNVAGARVRSIEALASLTQLAELDLTGAELTDLSPLSGLNRLERLEVAGPQVMDLSPLSGLDRLERLRIGGAKVTDLSPLSGLHRLERLDVGSTSIKDLSPIASLAALRSLDLSTNLVTDLGPLSQCANLRAIRIRNSPVSSLRPLHELSNLCRVILRKGLVSEQEEADLRQALPECEVDSFY